MRPLLSLVAAALATIAGLASFWHGAALHYAASAVRGPAGEGLLPLIAGLVLLGAAAATVAIHWVGAMVVGTVHGLLGLLALVVPFGNPFGGGIFSPVFQITRMLSTVDRFLGDGSILFYFSGTALVVGAFLAGASLGIRSRRLSAASSRTAVVVSSTLGGGLLLAATALLAVAGGQFARSIVQLFKYDAVAAGLTVVAGVLAGFAGLLLRWSSAGIVAVAALVLTVGVAGLVAVLPAMAPGRLLADYGLIALLGVSTLAAALGGLARPADQVPAVADDL